MWSVSRFVAFKIWIFHIFKKFVLYNVKSRFFHLSAPIIKSPSPYGEGLNFQPNHLYTAYWSAVNIPDGTEAPPKSIIYRPELQVYVANFGERKEDLALAVEVDEKIIGAVWTRIMDDYGHIDNETPSLAISLYKEYRGLGIGTAMMKKMLALLKERGYKRVSLSVQKANYAFKMYRKLGFEVINENSEEYIMVRILE